MLFCRAALPLSRSTLTYLAGVVRRHRKKIGSCWRKLNPGQQALLVLVHLRKGETFTGLAAGFGVGTTTAWRYVQETVSLLAARAPKLDAALEAARQLIVLADKGYIGAGEHVLTPYRARNKPASQRLPTAPTPGCAPRASVPTPSSRPGTFCASYAAAPGAPGGSLVMAIVEPSAVPAGFCPERATSGVAASGCSGVSC
jgi:hypothetical protein